jgi:hypothetical protein
MATGDIKSMRVLLLLWSGLLLQAEFLTKCDFKMMVAPHSAQVLSQFRGKSLGVSYGTILRPM